MANTALENCAEKKQLCEELNAMEVQPGGWSLDSFAHWTQDAKQNTEKYVPRRWRKNSSFSLPSSADSADWEDSDSEMDESDSDLSEEGGGGGGRARAANAVATGDRTLLEKMYKDLELHNRYVMSDNKLRQAAAAVRQVDAPLLLPHRNALLKTRVAKTRWTLGDYWGVGAWTGKFAGKTQSPVQLHGQQSEVEAPQVQKLQLNDLKEFLPDTALEQAREGRAILKYMWAIMVDVLGTTKDVTQKVKVLAVLGALSWLASYLVSASFLQPWVVKVSGFIGWRVLETVLNNFPVIPMAAAAVASNIALGNLANLVLRADVDQQVIVKLRELLTQELPELHEVTGGINDDREFDAALNLMKTAIENVHIPQSSFISKLLNSVAHRIGGLVSITDTPSNPKTEIFSSDANTRSTCSPSSWKP